MDTENSTTPINWMENLQSHLETEPESHTLAIQNALDECLTTLGWNHAATTTGLYKFLALCWRYSSMRVEIREAVAEVYPYDPEARKDFIQCIKNVRDELDKDEDGGKKKKSKKNKEEVQKPDDEDESAKKRIYLDASIPTIVQGCVDSLRDAGSIFQRGGDIVTIAKEKTRISGTERLQTVLKITPIKEYLLLEEVSKVANFYKLAGEDYILTKCPITYAKHVLDRSEHPYRHLTGITTTPTIRYDGSIIDAPGYDEATGLFYVPSNEYPKIPLAPTEDDARKALKELLEPFEDFPLAEDWHKSSAIAAILSIIARPIIRNSPLFSVTSTTPGAGKGLLVDVISIAATGQSYPISSLSKDSEEVSKRLFSIGQSGQRVTKFDNVSGLFGDDNLDAALTESRASTRKMRTHEDISVELQTVFFVTGNNIRYRGDLVRRIIPITLIPDIQNPEERTGFLHSNLIQWVMDNHPRLLAAALTILRAYFVAGRPKMELPRFGSFEQWSDLVRSAVVWLGMDDPYKGRRELQDGADTVFRDISDLLNTWYEAWPNKQKYTLAEVVKQVKQEALRERLGNPEVLPNQAILALGQSLTAYDPGARGRLEELNNRALSQKMPITENVSRVVDGLQLHSKTESARRKVYWVQKVDDKDADDPVKHQNPSDYKDSDDTGMEYAPDETDLF